MERVRDVGSGQDGMPAGDGLRTVGDGPGDHTGDAQEGSLFLHPTAVGQHRPAGGQQLGEHLGREWRQFIDIDRQWTAEYGLMDRGVWVDWKQKFDFWVAFCRVGQSLEDLPQGLSETLPPMQRNKALRVRNRYPGKIP